MLYNIFLLCLVCCFSSVAVQGSVAIRDSDSSSHVVSVAVTTDAVSEESLSNVVVDHRLVDVDTWSTILLVQVVSCQLLDFHTNYLTTRLITC